ncbi:MAG: hypothetical protein WD176_10075 [Pirellulales bacterium]
MADAYDPYREALVIETRTIWPAEYDTLDPAVRGRIERALHADPAKAANLEYVRLHSGFARSITVTPADIERLGSKS